MTLPPKLKRKFSHFWRCPRAFPQILFELLGGPAYFLTRVFRSLRYPFFHPLFAELNLTPGPITFDLPLKYHLTKPIIMRIWAHLLWPVRLGAFEDECFCFSACVRLTPPRFFLNNGVCCLPFLFPRWEGKVERSFCGSVGGLL